MLPALLFVGVCVASLGGPCRATAQQRARVTAPENFRLAPRADGTLLGRVNAGTMLGVGARDGEWREVTLEGWIWERSVRSSSSRDFALMVSATGGENLRQLPNGDVIGRLEAGTLLNEVSRSDGWVQVRRTAWMWGRSLALQSTPAAATPRATEPPRAAEPASGSGVPGSLDRQSLGPGVRLLAEPAGDTVGALAGRADARVVARADGWARVLVEAWVRESDLTPVSDSALAGVTAAEVRGGGTTYEGRILRWTLQFIALQTADELRRDMPAGQQYVLARGPIPETGFVYVLVSAPQARTLAALEPLATFTVLARVRKARSQYLGNPVLDLIEFSVRSGPAGDP